MRPPTVRLSMPTVLSTLLVAMVGCVVPVARSCTLIRYGPAASSASIQITQLSTISGYHLRVAPPATLKRSPVVMSRP